MSALLNVKNLTTHFNTNGCVVKAVDGVSFHINEEEVVGIVGESGCGKSVSQLSVMQLISSPGKIISGEILFHGRNLLDFKPNSREMRAIRGAQIAMIFQEPMTSLNPTLKIGRQLTEMLELHRNMSRTDAKCLAIDLMKKVGIPAAETRIDDYPHNISGGMRQRIMIAMALSCNPKLVIADEPTTALDVTTQAQILKLMHDMVHQFRSSLIIVTHNLGIVARYAKRIYIMYAGHIVESGTTRDIFANPRHPYTKGLLRCVPRLDEEKGRKLIPIQGLPPNLMNSSLSCAFAPRCDERTEECVIAPCPPLTHIGDQHYVSCHMER